MLATNISAFNSINSFHTYGAIPYVPKTTKSQSQPLKISLTKMSSSLEQRTAMCWMQILLIQNYISKCIQRDLHTWSKYNTITNKLTYT